jgi:hypothetical protein
MPLTITSTASFSSSPLAISIVHQSGELKPERSLASAKLPQKYFRRPCGGINGNWCATMFIISYCF